MRRIGKTWLLLLAAGLLGCGRPASLATATNTVRVVSLAPSLTEIIYAIGAGDCLVGRSRVCRHPAAVTNVPVAGDFGVPALEAIARCAPHLVVSVDLENPNSVTAIEQLGIRHVAVPCRSLDDIPRAMRTLGELLHRESAASALADAFSTRLAALRAAPRPAAPPRVFVEIWGDPLVSAGRQAFLSELITLAGGVNVMDDVGRDFFPVSPETVLARNPDVLILLEAADRAAADALIRQRAGWPQLAAVKAGRICAGLDRDILEVPGPRVLEGVELLRRCWERPQ